MRQIKAYTLINLDHNYRNAINYDGTNYYNPPMTINYRNVIYIIGAGSSDEVTIYKSGETLLVMTINYNLEYAGLESISLNDPDDKGIHSNVFLQNESDFTDCKNFFDLSTKQQFDYLMQWYNL